MFDLRRFLISVVIYAGTSAIATAIPVFLLPILTRILSPEDYGLVGLFLIYVNISTALVGLGMHGALSVRYFQQSFNFHTYVNACIWLTGIFWLGTSTIYMLLSNLLAEFLRMPSGWILLAITAACGNAILMLRLTIWQVELRPLPFGLTRITQAVTDVGLSLVLVLAIWPTWQGRSTAIATTLIIIGSVALWSMWRSNYLHRHINWAAARDALFFGLPLMPHLLGGLIISFIDRFLVANLLGAKPLGIYMVAAQVGLILNLVIVSTNRAFAPWMMRLLAKEDPIINYRIVKVSHLYMVIITGGTVLTIFASPFLIHLLAAPNFHDAQTVLPWVILGTGFTAFYYIVTNYLFYANRTGWLSAGTLMSAAIALPLSIYLIRTNGLIGAGQAYAAGQAITFIITAFLAQRAHPMPWLKAYYF